MKTRDATSAFRIAQRRPDSAGNKALKTAMDFDAQVMKSFLEQAYQGVKGEGPLGTSGAGAETWRSFLIDEQAKAATARGGIGIAPEVYRQIVAASGGETGGRTNVSL